MWIRELTGPKLSQALNNSLNKTLPTMPNRPDGCCHGRGREFESRRARHSFQKGRSDFA